MLKHAAGRTVAAGRADRFGSKIFRELKPGGGYTRPRREAARRSAFKVLRPGANPKPAFYKRKKLEAGPQLREDARRRRARDDGAAARRQEARATGRSRRSSSTRATRPPRRTTCSRPWSTQLAGAPADPLAPASVHRRRVADRPAARLRGGERADARLRAAPAARSTSSTYPTTYDGYDAVEAVAAQRLGQGRQGRAWAASPSPGITQLFTAGTQPPHLAAISPMSVTDDTLHRHRLPGRHLQLRLRARPGSRSAWTTPSRRPRAASRGPAS